MTELLRVSGVVKRFARTDVLGGVDLSVQEGEFITLLGPSGCGKTTLLRIIAGFESPTAGQVTLAGTELTRLPAHKRPVNTVFQRYLLFPHLNVFENVAFGLRVSRTSKADIRRRVLEALELVRLAPLSDRRAEQLSGGQAQRVSLARALVNRPRLLLLDEPLSALDLKVRQDMQSELRRIHRETGATFLYVTHDQQEAMSMSDRVAVMRAGEIEQIDEPENLYHRPATAHVARFVGDANLLPAARDAAGRVVLAGSSHELPGECAIENSTNLVYVARPESVTVTAPGEGLPGKVVDVAFLGSTVEYNVAVGEHVVRSHQHGQGRDRRFEVSEDVSLVFDKARCFVLPDETS